MVQARKVIEKVEMAGLKGRQLMGDDRHLNQGKQQKPDSETQDTLGPRETTLPRPEKENGPEGFGVGGGRVSTDKTE